MSPSKTGELWQQPPVLGGPGTLLSLLMEIMELSGKARSTHGCSRGAGRHTACTRTSLVFPFSGLLQFESLVIQKSSKK